MVGKTKKVNLIMSIVLTILGMLILICPLLKINNIKWIFFSILIIYSLSGLIKFVFNKDMKNLFLAAASIIIGIILLILNKTNEPLTLSFSLIAWTTAILFIKLFQTDYYHDQGNKKWKICLTVFVLYLIIGILTSINLYYSNEVQILELGFFFFVIGSLDLVENIMFLLLD